MGPDQLREVKESLEMLVEVKEKAEKLLSSLTKQDKLSPAVELSIQSCQNLTDLASVSAQFKTGSKTSLAERARQAGLEAPALNLLTANTGLELSTLVRSGEKGRETVEEVEAGLKHIIADIIAHDQQIAEVISKTMADCRLVLESKRAKEKQSEKNKAKLSDKKAVDPQKFENYFEFSCPCQHVKPHQVLAINRGEAGKVLSVKIVIPDDWFVRQLRRAVKTRWPRAVSGLVDESLSEGYKRLISPLVQRRTRASLTKTDEAASITVFLSNLRCLLLTPPHRNSTVLAIDPGTEH